MEKNILFPKLNGFVHGGDYNPEQWRDRPDILEEDIRMMKKAGVNCVTLGVFSWSVYEPREGEFHFEWLKKIMDSLYENGIYTILATPSAQDLHGWIKSIRKQCELEKTASEIIMGCVTITACPHRNIAKKQHLWTNCWLKNSDSILVLLCGMFPMS